MCIREWIELTNYSTTKWIQQYRKAEKLYTRRATKRSSWWKFNSINLLFLLIASNIFLLFFSFSAAAVFSRPAWENLLWNRPFLAAACAALQHRGRSWNNRSAWFAYKWRVHTKIRMQTETCYGESIIRILVSEWWKSPLMPRCELAQCCCCWVKSISERERSFFTFRAPFCPI